MDTLVVTLRLRYIVLQCYVHCNHYSNAHCIVPWLAVCRTAVVVSSLPPVQCILSLEVSEVYWFDMYHLREYSLLYSCTRWFSIRLFAISTLLEKERMKCLAQELMGRDTIEVDGDKTISEVIKEQM